MAKLEHEAFMQTFQKYIFERKDLHAEKEVEPVPYGQEVLICPEPVTFIDELNDYSNDRRACLNAFKKLLGSFERVTLSAPPGDFWFNTTTNGINLRPGLSAESNEPRAVRMGDTNVHALMAGQTGSGKSVLLNNLIFNLLAEYPPWELDLYLADFKKVEFSRYMNHFVTPHVSACAATSEIRYVISMIRYMVDCMNARETLFARLGYQKLSNLRESEEFSEFPPIVLPRMLLIVDEFQQMFLDANSREGEEIRSMLTAIVKKGRATGLHILFASQELSNTLSRSNLANFKIRFALNCSLGVSMDVLGNRAATFIRKGSVIYNTSDGNEEDNHKYLVPFINVDPENGADYSYFETFLAYMRIFNKQFTFHKSQKFYQEDMQDPFYAKDKQQTAPADSGGEFEAYADHPAQLSLEEILEKIAPYRKDLLGASRSYFDVLTLGNYVTFTNLRHDIQTLFLENGRDKNILAISPKVEDLAYMAKLFSYNFTTSPKAEVTDVAYRHRIYAFQPAVRNLFSLEEALQTPASGQNPDELEELAYFLSKRRMLHMLCQECQTPYSFAIENLRANLAMQRGYGGAQAERIEEQRIIRFHQLYDGVSVAELPAYCQKLLQDETLDEIDRIVAENELVFSKYHQNAFEAFPPTVVWIVGIDAVERIPEWLMQAMKNASDSNLLFILMANSEFDQMTQVAKHCDYLFVGGRNSRIYDRLQVNYTKREPDSIVLDLYIRSMEESRSFKKYKCSFGRRFAPTIPFDDLLD